MKKIMFIGISFVMLFILVGCDSNAETSNSPSGSTNTESNKKVYGINEDVFVKNDSGEYRLKITGIKETNERNEFSDKVANRVVVISYEYENISMDDDLSIDDWNFKVYDKDNNALETYPVDVDYSSSVGIGRKSSGSMAYALNNTNNYVELEYYDNMWNSKSDCVFKVEW